MNDQVHIWEQLQRIETLLVQAGARQRRELASAHIEQFDIPRHLSTLLIRVGSGLDPAGFVARDWQARYPYSPLDAIEAAFTEMTEAGLFEATGDGYRLSARGRQAVEAAVANMGAMIRSIPYEFAQADVEALHAFDRRILDAMQAADDPFATPIFDQRMAGIQPAFEPPAAWHHWQLAWSMIAFHEDEEEYRRQHTGLDPLLWFLRRNLWMVDRRPWLARARTLEQLAGRAAGYAPLPDAKAAIGAALAELDRRGWLVDDEEGYRLSPEGMQAADPDEAQIDANFLAAWPPFSDGEWQDLEELVARFTGPLDELQ